MKMGRVIQIVAGVILIILGEQIRLHTGDCIEEEEAAISSLNIFASLRLIKPSFTLRYTGHKRNF